MNNSSKSTRGPGNDARETILPPATIYTRIFKRPLDVIGSAFLLFVFLIPILLLALLIRLRIGRPVLFRQERIGRHERPFQIIKFRTMTNQVDASGVLAPDNERLTGLGRFLRRTSLDELPELVNVLKGDMSLVGPRPLLLRYLPFYKPSERIRHAIRPGLTGLAQVSGRNCLSWDDRFALDVEYVNRCSFFLDLYLLSKTVQKVLLGSGVIDAPDTAMDDLDVERRGTLS